MAELATKLPVKAEEKQSAERGTAFQTWKPFGDLWRFPFQRSSFDVEPFWSRELLWGGTPAVDIAERNNAYEVTAELPGLDEKNVEVKLVNGSLMIKGEKHEEKEEKRRDYHLQERRFGSFERHFRIPDSVDSDKIEAQFKNGVLTVNLPKKPEAQKAEKKIEVKAA